MHKGALTSIVGARTAGEVHQIVAGDGGQQRKPGFKTAVENVKALATLLTTEAENILGRRTAQVLGALVLFVVVVGTLLSFLNWYVAPSGAAQKQALVVTLAQILGGTALLLGLYFTWRGQQNAQAQLELNRRGQITERFTQAIDQLGSKDLEIRLGGIYSLERTAYEDRDNHWPVMEVLTAYVRQHAPQRPRKESSEDVSPADRDAPEPDIQAILSVIGRRSEYHTNREVEPGPIDLRGSNLRGANLQGAILRVSDLSRASLRGADLREASLAGTILEGTGLNDAKVHGADLRLARGLKPIQIRRADGNKKTALPIHITRPPKWDEQNP